MLGYRKEIDGLRALAVMPVLFFHAGFPGFYGGFVGVDVFFVISGYLITSIILSDLAKDRFSITNFYERRFRRIIPALFTVLLVSSLLAFVLLPAKLLSDYAESLVAVSLFASNIYFYFSSGYFATAAEELPLLHTWSLAVEEQYYLFFPLILMFLWQKKRAAILPAIVFISIVSLIFTEYYLQTNQRDANFYLIFSRAWELMVGSLVAFIPLHKISLPRLLRESLLLLALAGLLYSIKFFNGSIPFPSFYTLVPVLSTAVIIAFCRPDTLLGRVLCFRPIVGVGLISYSLYLWHQPLFAFTRIKSLHEPSLIVFAGLILCSMIMAYLSWRYIEAPFRNSAAYTRKKIFSYSAGTLLICMMIGGVAVNQAGFHQRFSTPDYNLSMTPNPMREQCHTDTLDYLHPEKACRYFNKNVTWATLGDSHAVELSYSLAQILEKKHEGILHLSFSGCPPSLLYESIEPGCSEWLEEALSTLESDKKIENILLVYRYSSFLFGDVSEAYPEVPDLAPNQWVKPPYNEMSGERIRELYWSSITKIIERLNNAGKKVFIVYPVPELPVHISKLTTPFSIFSGGHPMDLEKTTSVEYYQARNKYILNRLNSLEFNERLIPIKTADILCRNGYCPAVVHGKSLYFDDNHLSLFGASLLIDGANIIK